MRSQKEYIVCKQVAAYLRAQYPSVIFHFDLAGLNLSRAQAGMMKAIQGGRGWPDLFIAERDSKGLYLGLFIEIKPENAKLMKTYSTQFTSEHIAEQFECLAILKRKGFQACFVIGFDEAKYIIDKYLTAK